MEFNVKQFLSATSAKVLQEGKQALCKGIVTDTRQLKKDQLFFALKGPHFNGSDFCEKALQSGAWGVVVESGRLKAKNSGWIFEVKDPLHTLGDAARWWRSQFDLPCIAITGSNGKTTTKEMAASIFSTRWKTLKTEGNFNNLIGLPLTIDQLEAKHQAAVLELGMNDFGEIKRLTEITNPTVGAVTNAAAAHLEKLHTVEAVAKAKCELFEAMSPKSVAVYNAEDIWLSKFVKKFKGKKISFGMKENCDVSFEHMDSIGFDSMELKLAVAGKRLHAKIATSGVHNVMNAMASCAIALSLEFPIEKMEEGLQNFKPLKMRFEQIQLENGVRLVNDAYNANPVSMEAAFRTVGRAKRAGKFIAILGDMKELGNKAKALHQKVGQDAVAHGAQRLILKGEFAAAMADGAVKAGLKKTQIAIAKNDQEILKILESEISPGDVILVKASRAIGLESVAQALKLKFGI